MATPTQSSTPFMSDDEKTISELPTERGWVSGDCIHLFNGFWYSTLVVHGLLALQKHFKPRPDDVLIATYPKSGTTWLKALVFSIVNRGTYNVNHDDNAMHPLLTANPHDLVPWLEAYAGANPANPRPPESSLFQTHLAYSSLPQQIRNSSSCRIVCAVRDPKDVIVSYWHFLRDLKSSKNLPVISLQEAFDQFSRGASPCGPYWDHVTTYYKASIQFPDKVFLLRYEDLKTDTVVHVRRLAEFLGRPFSAEEENEGVVQKIINLCSFEKLSSLEVNRDGSPHETKFTTKLTIKNSTFFRKAKVGDSKNHLTKEMMEILDQITEDKFKEFDFTTSGQY